MSRAEAYEDLIEDETRDEGKRNQNNLVVEKQNKFTYSLREVQLLELIKEYIESYERWESNAYKGGRDVIKGAYGKKPDWEKLGRTYYELYLKSKRIIK
jgi:hypothetical protein